MSALSGVAGAFKVGTNTVAEIDKWSLDIGAEILDVSAFGDTWKEKIAGLKEWSCSGEGRWDMTDTAGQKALQDAILGGTTVAIRLYIDADTYYSGNAYVKQVSPGAELAGTVDVSFQLEGTGALSYT